LAQVVRCLLPLLPGAGLVVDDRAQVGGGHVPDACSLSSVSWQTRYPPGFRRS
jgi:hypothetical protein